VTRKVMSAESATQIDEGPVLGDRQSYPRSSLDER